MRARVAEYVSVMLDTYPDDILENHSPGIEKGKKFASLILKAMATTTIVFPSN